MRTSAPLLLALLLALSLASAAPAAGEGDCAACSPQLRLEPQRDVPGSCCSCGPLHKLELAETCCAGDLRLVPGPTVPEEPCDPSSPTYTVAYHYQIFCGTELLTNGEQSVTYHRDCGDAGCPGQCSRPDGAGTDKPSPYPDGRPPFHLFRLGMSRQGKPAGFVRLQVEPGDSGSARAGAFQPVLATSGADLVYDPAAPQLLRQVMSAECLLAISTNALSGYELRYYHPADVAGELDPDGFYQPLPEAVPFAAYSVRQDGAQLSVSGSVGGASRTNRYAQAAGGGWTLLRAGLLSETVATNFADGVLTATRTASRPDGGAARTTVDTRASVAGALRLTSRVEDPAGAALATRWSYSGTGRLELEERPDGSWTRYRRDAAGLCVAEVSPLGDQPPGTPDALCLVVSNAYASVDANDAGEAEWLDRPRTVSAYEAGVPVSRTYHAYYRTAGGERVEILERAATPSAAYGDPGNLRTKRTWFAESPAVPWADEPRFVESPGGLRDTHAYEAGVLDASDPDPALWSFVPDATGLWVRATATHGTADSPDGVPGRTLREVSVRDAFGRALLDETWACSGPSNFARLAWTATARDALGRATSVRRSDGALSETAWSCCGPESETGPDGVRGEYAYDALGRRVLAFREGLPGVSADRYTATAYDVHGGVLSEAVAAGGLSLSTTNAYDALGRLVWTRGPDGVETATLHGSNSTATVRGYGTALAATNLAVRLADGRASHADLNGVRKATYAYGANADGTRWTTVFEGPLGDASPAWTKTTTDFLGRTLLEERPGFGGTVLVTSNAYDTAGRLVATTTGHTAASSFTLQASNLFSYDELGQLVRTTQDLDLDGETDLAGPDRVGASDTSYESDPSGDWWRVSRSWTYPGDGSAAPFTNAVARTRLTGLGAPYAAPPPGTPSGDWLLASESVSLDALGNATVGRALLDRAARRTLQCTDTPASTLDAWTLAVDGLSLTNSTATGVLTAHAYDALGRRILSSTGGRSSALTAYDTSGRVSYTEDALANRTAYGYDALGRRTSATDPLDQTTHTAYDAAGRAVATWGSTYPVAYEYDPFGRMSAMTTTRDTALDFAPLAAHLASGQSLESFASFGSLDLTRWQYHEPTGLLTNKLYADGKGTAYTYTPDGRLASRLWSRGVSTSYSYAGSGELLGISYSDATPAVAFVYDRLGRQTSAITAGVSTNLYAYSLLGHLTNEVSCGRTFASALSRPRDPLGRPAGMTLGPDYAVSYGYDEFGRFQSVQSAQSADTNVFTYSYVPGTDLVSGMTASSGHAWTRAYEDNRNLIASVENTFGATVVSRFDYQNDALGRRTARADSGTAFSHPAFDRYGYNARSEVASGQRYHGTDTADTSQPYGGRGFGYAYDPIGNRVSATETIGGETLPTTYAANALNQYTAIANPAFVGLRGEAVSNAVVTVNANPVQRDQTATAAWPWHFALAADNAAGPAFPLAEIVAVVNPPGTNTSDSVESQSGHLYAPPQTEALAYDDDGNLVSDGRWQYTWNGENRLIRAQEFVFPTNRQPHVVEYAYDHRGRMVWKTVGPKTGPPAKTLAYLWDDCNIVAEHVVTDSGTNITYNVWGVDLSGTLQGAGGIGGLLSVTTGGAGVPPATFFPTFDGNGNVSEYTDPDGVVVAHREYDPFGGTVVAVGDVDAFTHWFSTKPWCPVTSLSEYEFRKYGPRFGRWLSRDPIGNVGGLSLLAFINNTPVTRIDPRGLLGCTIGTKRCCCCVDKLMIGKISRQPDTSPYMGHRFPLIVGLDYRLQDKQSDCTLQWKEKSTFYGPDRPDISEPGVDRENGCDEPDQDKPGSTCYPWHDRARGRTCPDSSVFVMWDKPGMLKITMEHGPRDVRKVLVIEVTLKSGVGCKCPTPSLSVTFVQDITVRNGLPDWEHSSP